MKYKQLNLVLNCLVDKGFRNHLYLVLYSFKISTDSMQAMDEDDFARLVEQKIDEIARRTKCKPDVRADLEYILLCYRGECTAGWTTNAWVKVMLRFLEISHDNSNWQLTQLLEKLPFTVDAIYDRFLCSIPADKRWVTCRMLLIIAGARRPLTVKELGLLLAIRPSHKTADQLERACQSNIRYVSNELLGPFVLICNGTIQLIDQTAMQYLLNLANQPDNHLCTFFGIRKTEPDEVLAEACMSYLLLKNVSNTPHKTMENTYRLSASPMIVDEAGPDGFDDSSATSSDNMFHGETTQNTTTTQVLSLRYGLFDNASKYWASHLSKFRHQGAAALFPLAKALSEPDNKILHGWLSYYWSQTCPGSMYPSDAGPVFIASFFGHPVSLQLYLKEKNVDRQVLETALYWVSNNGHSIVVRLLLQKSIKPLTAVHGKFPQHAAAEFGHIKTLELFLAHSTMDMNDTYQGRTPISLAAGAGHIAIVTLLISAYQIRPDLPDNSGMMGLSWASANNRSACVAALLSSLRVQAWRTDLSGRTALSLAASHGHLEIVNLFLRIPGTGVDLSDACGRTPLSYAAGAGHASCVEALLGCPAVDASVLDRKGRSALSHSVEGGHVDVVRALLTHSPSCADVPDHDGRAPLAWATDAPQGKRAAVAHLLLANGTMGANRPDREGLTPIYYAIYHRCLDMLEVMVQYGAVNINQPDQNESRPFSCAVLNRDVDSLPLLAELHGWD